MTRIDTNGNVMPDCWQFVDEDLSSVKNVVHLLLESELWKHSNKAIERKVKEQMIQPFRAQLAAIHERAIRLNMQQYKKDTK